MRRLLLVLAMAAFGQAARAEGEAAGDFDYYVMSLSWSAAWCALEGDARDDPQCDDGRGLTFILHGLWPQHEDGWPSFCRTGERDPSRAQTGAMADVMGGSGLAFYQWKKHGRCSGLSAEGYYRAARAGRPPTDPACQRDRGGVHRGQSRPSARPDHHYLQGRADPGGTDLSDPRPCPTAVRKGCNPRLPVGRRDSGTSALEQGGGIGH